MTIRVATFPFTNSMVNENMRLQVKYSDINTQISSGLKSQDYKGISADSQYLLSLESSQDKLKAYNQVTNTVIAVANTMYSTMDKVQTLANSMLSTVTASQSGGLVGANVLTAQADHDMKELTGLLNLKLGGRYVFSGSDTGTAPVNLSDPAWVAQTAPSSANSTYYQGNAVTQTVQVSESYSIDYGITANNSAFEKLFRAFNLIYNNPSTTAALQEASDLIQQSVDEVANLQGMLSTHVNAMQTQVDSNETDATNLQEIISNIKETDIPSASVNLAEIQSQLEASYSASVRILNLNLAQYL